MSFEFALDVPVVGGDVTPEGLFLEINGNLLTLNGELLDMEQP